MQETLEQSPKTVLVTGASGFIGRHLVARLRAGGHIVIGTARNPVAAGRANPAIEWRHADLNRKLTPEAWNEPLRGVDAVINCAGILQSSRGNDIDAVHAKAPIALFKACEAQGVHRVIQISATGTAASTEFSRSKAAADAHLGQTGLDWVVVRPSLVYARDGYGGTSLFRALAALPFVLPLPGSGGQVFQPLAMDDLAEVVARLIEGESPKGVVLEVGGPEALSLRDILLGYRRWLGLGRARIIEVPMALIRIAGRIGDLVRWFGGRGALSTTSVRQLEFGNTTTPEPLLKALGVSPRRFSDWLEATPSGVQDRWHARLYFLRPLLRVVLGLFWLWTGLTTAFFFPVAEIEALMREARVPASLYGAVVWLGAGFDIALGLLLLLRWRVRAVATVGLAASIGYLGALSVGMPELWLHPFGPFTKVLPIMVAMVVMMAIEDDR